MSSVSSVSSLPHVAVADDRALAFQRYNRPELLRIGLVLLDTDYTLERDWHRLVGDDMELFCTRMPTHAEVTPAALKALEAGITPAAATLVPGLPLHTLAFGCTSAGLLIGDVPIACMQCARKWLLLIPGSPSVPPWRPWRPDASPC